MAVADFEKGKSYAIKDRMSVMSPKDGQWLKPGTLVEVVRQYHDDDAVLVKLPDASFATCASDRLTSGKVTKPVVDFADAGTAHMAGNGVEEVPPGKEVTVDGKKMIERDIPVLFDTGSYPDKNFTMTPEEAAVSLKNFNEKLKTDPAKFHIPMPITHGSTILDAHNGSRLVHLELKDAVNKQGEKVKRFSGKALIEPFLDNMLRKDKAFGVSARWKNEEGKDKDLVHVAFVPNPRVEEARIVAGTNFEKELEKQLPMLSGYAGSTPTDPNAATTQDTDQDLPEVPADETAANEEGDDGSTPIEASGAVTNPEGEQPEEGLDDLGDIEPDDEDTGNEGAMHGEVLFTHIQDLLEQAMQEAMSDPTRAAEYKEQLSKLSAMLAEFSGGEPKGAVPESATGATPTGAEPEFSKDNKVAKAREIPAELEAEWTQIAKDTVNVQISPPNANVLPADFDKTWKALVQARKDDYRFGVADFADGENRYKVAVKELKERPKDPMGVFKSGADFHVLEAARKEGQQTDEEKRRRIDALLATSSLGQATLAQRQKAATNGHSKN